MSVELRDRIEDELRTLRGRVDDLEKKVRLLGHDCGDDLEDLTTLRYSLYGATAPIYVPTGPTRFSAMQGVHLILQHLGLKLKHIKSQPARTELAPKEPT